MEVKKTERQPAEIPLPRFLTARAFATDEIRGAVADLLAAISRACERDDIARDQAEAFLSLLYAYLWDESQRHTARLPQVPKGKAAASLSAGTERSRVLLPGEEFIVYHPPSKIRALK